MVTRGRVRIGTSGWNYRHWRGRVYPTELPVRRWLESYAASFDTVEVNNSFYRLPTEETFRGWADQVPPGFLFAVKASRYLTHMKKLKDAEGPLENIIGHARALGLHLGPVLYQLPPGWHVDLARLRNFLGLLPTGIIHVIEFRDPSWYTPEVRAALKDHRVGFCIHDLRNVKSPGWVTAPTVYIRFHGPTTKAYAGRYSNAQLRAWAERIIGWRQSGHHVFAYFNNDDAGYAVENARELRDLVGPETPLDTGSG